MFGDIGQFIQYGIPSIAVAAAIVAFVANIWPALRLLSRTAYRNAPLGRPRALIRVLRFVTFGIGRTSFYRAACMWTEMEALSPRPDRPDRYTFENEPDYREKMERYKHDRGVWRKSAKEQLGILMRGATDEPRKIVVPTCFDLFSAEDQIERYFIARNADKPASDNDAGVFQARVEVTEGFLAPLHLLAGLISHAAEDWKPVLDNYGALMTRTSDPLEQGVRALQLGLFSCWLLWGPSIPICTCHQWIGPSHLQFGYGDENNSIALLPKQSGPVTPYPLDPDEDGRYPVLAVQATVTGVITWAKAVGLRGFAPVEQPPPNGEHRQLLLVADGIDRPGGSAAMVAQRYYSAYIWVIFVICDQDGQPLEAEQWRNMLVFFEHGNIAEQSTLEALKHQLAHKARYSIGRILSGEPTMTLRYACAIDESGCGSQIAYPPPVGRSIREIVFADNWAGQFAPSGDVPRVSQDFPADRSYSACRLPDVLADYPRSRQAEVTRQDADQITFVDITCSDEHVTALAGFYSTLFVTEFPDPNERESLANMVDYLRKKDDGWYGSSNYHVVLAMSDGKAVGGAIFDYLVEPSVGVIEFLVVAAEARRYGVGKRLLDRSEQLMRDDARTAGQQLNAIVAEMNDPLAPSDYVDNVDPTSRALIWHKWGYVGLDFPYQQPALSPTQAPVQNLIMIAKLFRADRVPGLAADLVRSAVHEYLRLAMGIATPEDDAVYREMAAYLDGLADRRVPTIPLASYVGHESGTLHTTEVSGPGEPEFESALERYRYAVETGELPGDQADFLPSLAWFLRALSWPGGHHLWLVRGAKQSGPVEGIAAVFRLPDAGFVGLVPLTGPLAAEGKALRLLFARMEDRMLRDKPDSAGWYLEIGKATDVTRFTELGCQEIPTSAEQPYQLLFKPFGRSYQPSRPSATEIRAVAQWLAARR